MESTDWSDCNLKTTKCYQIQTFRPTHITFPHRKFILWDGHGNQNAVTSWLVAVQYEGATRANPENWKMKVKQFSMLCVDLIDDFQTWSTCALAPPKLEVGVVRNSLQV